jgi:hypothetical protein
MIAGMLEQLERSGEKMVGLSLEDLRDAMSHPEAAKSAMEMMGREASSVQQGDPAPDFKLPRLDDPDGAAPVQLSTHFGRRPVALIFGSYT